MSTIVCLLILHLFFINFKLINGQIEIEVIDVNYNSNCSKCDNRSVCVRLSNSTGVSCVCLPGFILSPSTGRCILQEIPLNGLCDSRYECFNGGLLPLITCDFIQQIEKCLVSSCYQGFCSNTTNRCECLSGYAGLMCELDINECAENSGICGSFSCINLLGGYKCNCDVFRSGKRCEKVSAFGLFVIVISSITVILIVLFLVLLVMRTLFSYRLSKQIARERELQLHNPCMATLTAGGIMSDDRLSNGSLSIRPMSHRIYVPMETGFVNVARFQANTNDDEDKKHILSLSAKFLTTFDGTLFTMKSH